MGGRQPSRDPILIVLDENIAGDGLRDALMPAALAAGCERRRSARCDQAVARLTRAR
jgi:hypothetical protein